MTGVITMAMITAAIGHFLLGLLVARNRHDVQPHLAGACGEQPPLPENVCYSCSGQGRAEDPYRLDGHHGRIAAFRDCLWRFHQSGQRQLCEHHPCNTIRPQNFGDIQ